MTSRLATMAAKTFTKQHLRMAGRTLGPISCRSMAVSPKIRQLMP